jgi:ribosomal protein S18 acetylase RimI-like enzyme
MGRLAREHVPARGTPKSPAERIAQQLLDVGEEHLRRLGARRVTALVPHDDDVAAAFWDSAGYPVDPAIDRRVRNL